MMTHYVTLKKSILLEQSNPDHWMSKICSDGTKCFVSNNKDFSIKLWCVYNFLRLELTKPELDGTYMGCSSKKIVISFPLWYIFMALIWTILKQNVLTKLEMHQNMSPNFSNIQFLIIVLYCCIHDLSWVIYSCTLCVLNGLPTFPNEDFFQYYFRSCTWLRVWITKFFLWLTLSTKELSSCGEIDMGRV